MVSFKFKCTRPLFQVSYPCNPVHNYWTVDIPKLSQIYVQFKIEIKNLKTKLKTNGSVGLAIEENWNWSKEPNLSFRKDSVYNLIVMDVRRHEIVQQLGSGYNLY